MFGIDFDLDFGAGEFANDAGESANRESGGAIFLALDGDDIGDAVIEISGGEAELAVGGAEEHIGEDGQGSAGADDILDRLKTGEEFLFADAEFHREYKFKEVKRKGESLPIFFDEKADYLGWVRLASELIIEEGDDVAGFFFVLDFFADEAMGMENGSVVAASERFADFAEGAFGEFSGEIHGNLAWESDICGAPFAGHIGDADIEVFGDASLDLFDGDGASGFFVEDIFEEMLDFIWGWGLAFVERDVSGHAHEGTFEAADIGADAFGEEIDDFWGHFDAETFGFFAEDSDAGFGIWELEFGGEAPFEAGDEAGFEISDFGWGAIAAEDDLFMAVEEGIESMKELFLGAAFIGEELDIIDEEDIGLAVAFAEFDQGIILDGVDEVIGEGFAGDVDDFGLLFGGDGIADGVHEVGFA